MNQESLSKKIYWQTNNNQKIYKLRSFKLKAFIGLKLGNFYFLNDQNNVVWCQKESFLKFYDNYEKLLIKKYGNSSTICKPMIDARKAYEDQMTISLNDELNIKIDFFEPRTSISYFENNQSIKGFNDYKKIIKKVVDFLILKIKILKTSKIKLKLLTIKKNIICQIK